MSRWKKTNGAITNNHCKSGEETKKGKQRSHPRVGWIMQLKASKRLLILLAEVNMDAGHFMFYHWILFQYFTTCKSQETLF